MPRSQFTAVISRFFRRPRLFLLLVFLLCLTICWIGSRPYVANVLAQRRAEGRDSISKPKSKPKSKPPSRTKTLQQQANADGSITGVPWIGEAGVSETTADIMTRELALRARSRSGKRVEREPEPEPIRPNRENLPQNPQALPGAQWPPIEDQPRDEEAERQKELFRDSLVSGAAPTAFLPSLTFTAATLADTGSFPPDTMGAVGPTQFLVALNGRIRVFNKTSGAQGDLNADMDSFFNSVRGGELTTDPRVVYDRLSGRWFLLIINVAASNNRILLAVSNGATINSATVWTFYYFNQNQVSPAGDNGCFADYPSLGVDANALYVGTNQFCNRAFTNTTAYVIRKSSVTGGGQIVVCAFRNLIDSAGGSLGSGIFSPHGVSNTDPDATEGYFIGTDATSFGRLAMRRVANPGGLPVLSANISVNVLATATPITVRHKGNINGVNGRLDAIDDRLLSAQFRNGSIWAAHNIAVNNLGFPDVPRTRNAVRWYEIADVATAGPRLVQAGTIFAPTDTNTEDERNYWIPSLAVSGQGHMLLGFNTAGTNEYINAAIAGRLATDVPGTLQTPQLLTASPGPYNPSSNSGNQQGRRRWGDYSFTSLDPCDDMTMWTIQEFCDAANSYGLRVAKIPAPPPATPAAASPPAVVAGQASVNVTITGLAVNGAGFYDPGEGAGCRLRASVTGGVIVNSLQYINPTTVMLNLSTVNAGAGPKTILITNPDGQAATGSNILTVGACAYNVSAGLQNFTAAGGGGTINVETASNCGWTAVSNSNFITINTGAVAAGNGAVTFTVAPTVGPARSGTITVAGQTIPITQSAGGGCRYTLSSAGKNFPTSGGTGSFAVTTTPDCAWTPAASDSFVKILFPSLGQGNGVINFLIAANDLSVARNATINVGGQIFTITQDAPPFEIAVDDGVFETTSGNSAGGISYRVNRLTPAFYPATLNAVAVYFPDNGSIKPNDSFSVVVGINADGDANIDGTTFQTISAQVQSLAGFNVVSVPPLTLSQGDFVVGIRLNQAPNVFPFALDTTKPKSRSYLSTDGASFALVESVGTHGNYGIRARLERPPKLIVGAGSSLLAESCPPSNRAIDPGETVTVNLSLGNNGSVSTQNLTATLLASSNVITSAQTLNYGVLIPGGPTVTRAFTFTASGACGSVIPVKVNLKDGAEDLGVVSFNFTLGAIGAAPRTFSYSGGTVKIPDGDARGIDIPLTVSGFAGNIADLNFRIDGTGCTADSGSTTVGVDHTWVGDLLFKLTSPAGTTVTIVNRAGGSGNSGKNFCQTVLDDDVANATSIGSVSPTGPPPSGPPYTGIYKPSNPLSAFDGENPNGTWTLTVTDSFTGDTGNVRAFSLILTGFACCSTGCLDVAGSSATSGAVGSQVTISGTGLDGVTSVKFGDVPASFIVNSNTSITATVPGAAQSAPIILSKPGCVDAQTLPFTAFPAISLAPPSLLATTDSSSSMTVRLGYPQSNGTVLTLTSSNPALATVPTSIMLPAGVAAGDFQLAGVASGGPVTITAKLPAGLGGGSASSVINVVTRAVSVVNSAGSIGRTVGVPIVLESKGEEASVSFSLNFPPTLLTNPQVVAGADAAGAQVSVISSLASQGRIGVTVSLPAGQKFTAGNRQIAVIAFDVPASVQPGTATLDFSDQPITRLVKTPAGGSIRTQFVTGSIRLGQGYEADVTPRPLGNNNGALTITDWVQVGRFLAGLDTPAAGSEFQRADCAPRDTLGDGKISLIDWVQAGRFIAGLDAPTVAGGPTAPAATARAECGLGSADCGLHAANSDSSMVLLLKTAGNRLAIKLDATGVENALSFSVNYDPERWRFVAANAGSDAPRATLIINSTQTAEGRVGILLALPSGATLPPGEREAVVLQFAPRGRTRPPLNVRLGDAPIATSVVDAAARPAMPKPPRER